MIFPKSVFKTSFFLSIFFVILNGNASASSLACGVILEKHLSLIRSQLIATEGRSISQASEQQNLAQSELNDIDATHIENCSKREESLYQILNEWSSDVFLKIEIESENTTTECRGVVVAKYRWLTSLSFMTLRNTLYLYSIGNSSEEAKHAEATLAWIENYLGEMPDIDIFTWTSPDIESYQKRSRREYLMIAASAPEQCTSPPYQFMKSIKSAGPGPSLIQTDAWLIENLPVGYFGIGAFETVSQKAEYDINDCSLKIDIETHTTQKKITSLFFPLYVIEVDASSQSFNGKTINFGEYGHGTVNFSDVRPDSILVKTKDTSETLPLALGYKDFDLAFRDEDVAQRVAKALKRLAALCGAKNDPF